MRKEINNFKIKKYVYTFLIAVVVFLLFLYSGVNSINTQAYRVVNATFTNNDNEKIASYELKVADTVQLRTKGLMFVKALNDNEGMLFSYDEDIVMNFWMKNTFVPLDIVFLNEHYIVVGIIENMIPQGGKNIRDDDIPRYSINRKSRYAIEIPAFSAKKYGIKIGYKVNIQN